MTPSSASLLRRLLFTATGVAPLVVGCAGRIDDSAEAISGAGGSVTAGSGGSGGSEPQGGSGGSVPGGSGGKAGNDGKGGKGGSGGSHAGSGGSHAGSGGGPGGAGGSGGSTGGASGSGGSPAGWGGSGGSPAGAGGSGGSPGGWGGTGGTTVCPPEACIPGQTTCGSGPSQLFTCQYDANGCASWQESACAPGDSCDPSQGNCVLTTPTTCKAGADCVPSEWCSPAPQFGTGNDNCTCTYNAPDLPPTLVCNQGYPWGQTVKVCYAAPADVACMPLGSEGLYQTLGQRFSLSCAYPQKGPTAETTSKGQYRCCYEVGVNGCIGRPLLVETALRIAALSRRAAWG